MVTFPATGHCCPATDSVISCQCSATLPTNQLAMFEVDTAICYDNFVAQELYDFN